MARRVRLSDTLHARPASLLVRLSQRFEATIEIRTGERVAVGSRILEVLGLGAVKGDEVEIVATGADAEEAAAAIEELVERGFLTDLVPEIGAAAAPGIAIGRALVMTSDGPASSLDGTVTDPRAHVKATFARATSALRALIGSLEAREAELFEPEVAILAELEPAVLRRIDAGEDPANAIAAETENAATDLILDARARLMEALASNAEGGARRFAALREDAVLVTDALTPSLVAAAPRAVVGIVAAGRVDIHGHGHAVGFTSHAAILARGRGLPLAFVPSHVASAIGEGEVVVVDTMNEPASVWTSPSEALVESARTRRAEHAARDAETARAPEVTARLAALGVALRVNVSQVADAIPEGALGVGLVRTELLFAGRHAPPSEAEQLASALAIARRAHGGPVIVRLFDAGGDKPIAWLPPPMGDPDARGMALLFASPDILGVQVRALARAAERAPVKILLPLVRSARDVEDVRRLAGGAVEIGAMIETPAAAMDIDSIAAASSFICIGTNDLSAEVLGEAREVAALSRDPRIFQLVARIASGARAAGRTVTVCGELAGDLAGARALVGLGVNALSVSPGRLAAVRRALADATREDCTRAARDAMQGG